MFLRKVREDEPLQIDHVIDVFHVTARINDLKLVCKCFGLPSEAELDWKMFATKNSTKKQVVILFHLQTSFL